MGGVRGGHEVHTDVMPAPLLDAGHRDRKLRAAGDEHADVEDPVLLRSDELLAVVEQHVLGERVHDAELGDRSRSSRPPGCGGRAGALPRA